MHRRLHLSLAVAALTLLAWSSSTDAAADQARCGGPGKPACPLQAWMRTKIAAPLAKRNGEVLAANLQRLEQLNPKPKQWGNWNKFAREGADAARRGDFRVVKTTCARCHRVYRRGYNLTFRSRELPKR